MSSVTGPSPMTLISRDIRDASWLYLAQGVGLILVGILIVILPELLQVLVATYLIVVGVLSIAAGWRLRRARRAFDDLGRLLLG